MYNLSDKHELKMSLQRCHNTMKKKKKLMKQNKVTIKIQTEIQFVACNSM